MDLQNCESVEEAWVMLDSKYGNKNVISASLIESFIRYSPKGRSPESKLIDLRDTLASLHTDLKAVDCLDVLTSSTFHLQAIFKNLPRSWQNKWSENKESLVNDETTEFKALFDFIKKEAQRIETDLPWTLDPEPPDTKN